MKLWEYTGEELIGGAEITSDVILAPEIEMPWKSDKVEGIMSNPNYATAPATGHKGLDISLWPRDRVGHQFVINQPKNTDLGHRGQARALDRQITGMDGFDPLDSRHCFLAMGFQQTV